MCDGEKVAARLMSGRHMLLVNFAAARSAPGNVVPTCATVVETGTGPGSVAPRDRRGIVVRPGLFDLLLSGARVTLLSAPPGSGKTVLLRCWIAEAGIAERAAWVSVTRQERDPQRFWLAVLDALRATVPGSGLVRALTPAPDLDGWSIVERLLEDLDALREPLLLVIDDLHELEAQEALEQLELLLTRAPRELRFMLSTRRDVRLGLHRLRLDGDVEEIRAPDLRFTLQEAHELFEAAGVRLSDATLEALVERTEGWAAGLRLAALSLARHEDPERFAASFSGSNRAVADYLLSEVLDRQPPEVARLLLRTSILEYVPGQLAERLSGIACAEAILARLEDQGAFVVSLDPKRTSFRYQHLFADLLALELRRTAPDELPALHTTAAEWFAGHDMPIEAIRHAQAAENWGMAARVLSDHWFGLYLDGRHNCARELLGGFPPHLIDADAELAAVAATDELTGGSLEEAERYVTVTAREAMAVPEARRGRLEVALAMLRLSLARQRNDLSGVAAQAQRLLLPAEAPEPIQAGLGEDLRAFALINLGIAEIWTRQWDDADRHLAQALALAEQIERPLLQVMTLSHWALLGFLSSHPLAEERSRQAIDLAAANGWAEETPAGVAYTMLGSILVWRGQLEEADEWLARGERVVPSAAEPVVALLLRAHRGLLEDARGRYEQALRAFGTAEELAGRLVTPHMTGGFSQAHALGTLIRMGDTERAARTLGEMDEQRRDTAEMRVVLATLRLAQDDPEGATAALSPILERAGAAPDHRWETRALLVEAIARDALRDPGAASRALERALELAEPQGHILPFFGLPLKELLERHLRHGTAHASLLSEILNALSGKTAAAHHAEPLEEALSASELRVLRYLPTNLPAPEIATELFVSINTIRTHMRHVYAKLGVHKRADAVERARQLGLLSPSTRSR
jgi:LuxR family maltose regulon positive regulatory protein